MIVYRILLYCKTAAVVCNIVICLCTKIVVHLFALKETTIHRTAVQQVCVLRVSLSSTGPRLDSYIRKHVALSHSNDSSAHGFMSKEAHSLHLICAAIFNSH